MERQINVKVQPSIDNNIIKESMLSIKQLSILLGISRNRLYAIAESRTKITHDEIAKLNYINERLSEIEAVMANWDGIDF